MPECVDVQLQSCSPYYWAIKTMDVGGNWSAVSNSPHATTKCISGFELMCGGFVANGPPTDAQKLPLALKMGEIFPNPARSSATLMLAIPAHLAGADVELTVFDVAGRRVRSLDAGKADPGMTQVAWDLHDGNGQSAPNGVYFVRVRVGSVVENRRVLLVK